RTLPKGGLAVGASVEALVARSSADQLRLRIGAAEAEMPAAGFSWARGWTTASFRPGDVVLVKIEKVVTPRQSVEVSLDQEPDSEGAFLALDANTGYVRAMVGGYDYSRSQFNRAVQAFRQPGSA